MREFGFTPEHVVETAKAVLSRLRADVDEPRFRPPAQA
jgi:hypothetical protein